MIAVLRQRNFGLLWLAGLISMMGDWVLMVGVPVEVYRRTGSTLATAGMLLAWLIPAVVLGSVAGVFVDRWDRRRLMIVVNILLAVTLLPLLAVDSAGIWLVYVVFVVASILGQLFEPAEVALLPNLLEGGERELVRANALSGINRQLARIVGPAIGGVAVAAGGLVAVTVLDAISFVVAAGLILAIRTTRGRAEPAPGANPHHDSVEHEAATAWTRLRHEWAEGIRIMVRHPVLRALLAFVVIRSIGEGLTGTLFVPWATDALHTDATGYGWLLSTQAIGGLAGAAVVGRFGHRIDPLRLLIGSAVTFGLIDLVLFTYPAFYPVLAPALVMMVIVGVPGAAMGVALTTIQQSNAEDRIRGRVVGGLMALGALGSLIGAVGAGFLGEVLPVIPLLIVQGSGYVIAGLAVWRLTRGVRAQAAAA
ncbi:MAG TPA: MFS transporter [Candidatus Limnocylindrales bacterium]|nr:MFS transporter [Candidatus Limnocylindrales bacterium]